MTIRRCLTPFVLLLTFVLVACDDGERPTSPTPTPAPVAPPTPVPPPVPTSCPAPSRPGSMSAVIDGETFTAVCVFALTTSAPLPVGGFFSISATDAAPSPRLIAMAVNASGPGTYPIASGSLHLGNASWVVTSGTMTLASLTTTGASGTFSFNATGNGTRVVNNGTFTVTF